MPRTRNPLSLSHIVDKIEGTVQHARTTVSPHNPRPSLDQTLAAHGLEIPYIDLQMQFIGASGLPKMDIVGSADPYFVANLDGKLSFMSMVKQNMLSPMWNEIWCVKNIPSTANLQVKVMDKDEGVTDDYFGKFSIDSTPSQDKHHLQFPYLFDGPIRYSRHYSPTVGRLTNLNDARLYSTWKIFLKGVPLFFRDTFQPWNRNYKATQSIFQGGPASLAVRSGIQAGHRVLYACTADNAFGIIEDSNGVLELLHTSSQDDIGPIAQRVKPAVYTYIISAKDDSFQFSKTGAAFFVDFASKHALHSNCAEVV
ncbi:uncharacterized protein LACBIDRAFT_315422 [Laccaria bicolor S238N-H82]|uniref:Predicted protein n=1 Tax=Laccaria bicolor (strain S238N-H82 / ATCC MYA-4686) TaxID=486041 RepID=B0D2C5_LACBS|nr:uncharacterized protein LACBIDRAFT_315422 [Laccaria bicolor S238N-H82]EDR11076.1 predicted protein [Laccaria bicolor S238N-H82]|eukprot:XP_001878377.1 predicted protein [Laccaria bicolor S238N-H82]